MQLWRVAEITTISFNVTRILQRDRGEKELPETQPRATAQGSKLGPWPTVWTSDQRWKKQSQKLVHRRGSDANSREGGEQDTAVMTAGVARFFFHHHQVYLCRKTIYRNNNSSQNKNQYKKRIWDREAAKRPCSHQVEQPPSVRNYFFMLLTFV